MSKIRGFFTDFQLENSSKSRQEDMNKTLKKINMIKQNSVRNSVYVNAPN
jgi:hypothetical protein